MRTERRRFVMLALLGVMGGGRHAQGQPAQSAYAQIGPLRMYYEIHGQGAPLLMLHGGGSTIQTTFGTIMPVMAKSRRIIAPEQQAHGHTADVDRPLSFRQMASDTAALIDRLGLRRVDVLGFSNGGSVAMELAMQRPDLVRRLVLASVYSRRDAIHPQLLRSFETTTAKDMPQVYRQAYLSVAPNPGDLATLTPKLMRNLLSFEGWTDSELASIKAPTMVLQADQDVAPTEHVAALAKTLPDAQLVVLPGGHGGYLGEVLAAAPGSNLHRYTAGIITEFLDGIPR